MAFERIKIIGMKRIIKYLFFEAHPVPSFGTTFPNKD
jgi:hypothetical protein